MSVKLRDVISDLEPVMTQTCVNMTARNGIRKRGMRLQIAPAMKNDVKIYAAPSPRVLRDV